MRRGDSTTPGGRQHDPALTLAGQDVPLRDGEDPGLRISPATRAGRASASGRPVLLPSMDHLHPKDCVRLREDYLGLLRGAVGVVIGFYRTEEPTVAVAFELGVRRVPFDLLELLSEDE